MPPAKLFCVIDPTTVTQASLERAQVLAKLTKASIHAYACVTAPSGPEGSREAEVERYKAWLTVMMKPLIDAGCEVTSEIEVSDDWRQALAPAARRAGANLIIKSSRRRTPLQRRFLRTSDWLLLRAAHCPVLLAKSPTTKPITSVLAAVNLNAADDAHQKLNDIVIATAKQVVELTGAELYAVNAHSDSLDFVHPPDLARRLGIPRAHAHVGEGDPADVIQEVAGKLGWPLVVIASVARTGLTAAVVGNTAERILDGLETDILTVVSGNR